MTKYISKGYTNGNVLVCGGGVEHNGHNGRIKSMYKGVTRK